MLPIFVHHVSGSVAVDCSSEDLIVGCLVRNGEIHVEDFLRYHFTLGAKHVVLLDNGSTDSTIFLAQKFQRATILQTKLPFHSHKLLLKKYLYDHFGRKGWFLIVDIDERFDFPGSNKISLRHFLRYLNQNRFTAVVAQMLDLFPLEPISCWPTDGETLRKKAVWYDHSRLTGQEYPPTLGNQFSSPIPLYSGGIRKTAFGVNALLTKHPLLYRQGGAKLSLSSSHWCHRGAIADVSGLLLHYKFDGTFRQKCLLAVREQNYYQASAEYKAYLGVLTAQPDLALGQSTARQFTTVDALVQDGFLTRSERYLRFLYSCSRHRLLSAK
jgi:Glycosyl transferase family 2